MFQRADPKSTAVSMNLLLVYIKMGVERLAPSERGTIAMELLKQISQRPLPQQATLLQICSTVLLEWSRHRAPRSIEEATAKEVDKEAREAESSVAGRNDADDTVVLSWLSDLVLYQPPPEATLKANLNPAPPPGLSGQAVDRLLGANREYAVVGEALGRRKIAALKLLRWGRYDEGLIYPVFVVASADPRSDVHEYAEDYLHRGHPNIEAPSVINALLSLYLGKPHSVGGARDGRGPVSVPTKLKILQVLVKSKFAATQIPCIKVLHCSLLHSSRTNSSISTHHDVSSLCDLQVVFDGLNGAQSSEKHRAAAIQLGVSVVRGTTAANIPKVAPVFLQTALKMLAQQLTEVSKRPIRTPV